MKTPLFMRCMLFGLLTTLYCITIYGQQLQIHQLGLGDGDAALIIAMDSTIEEVGRPSRLDTVVVLLDAQREYAAVPLFNYVDSVLKSIKRNTIDYVIVSHIHIDHYGSMVELLTKLISKGYKISALFDRTQVKSPSLDWNQDPVDSCYDYINLPAGGLSQAALKYKQTAVAYSLQNKFRYDLAIQTRTKIFWKNNFKNISMDCIVSNGVCLAPNDSLKIFLDPASSGKFKPRSENDLSFGFLISFLNFHYFTSGDLGGPSPQGKKSGYCDGETPVSNYFKSCAANFHYCAYKVSHHGSAHSTSADYVMKMNPTLAIISASLRKYGRAIEPLPTSQTLNNLNNHKGTEIRFTFIPNPPLDSIKSYCTFNNLAYLQDIVLIINRPPNNGPIDMIVKKNRRTLNGVLDGTTITETIQCTKH